MLYVSLKTRILRSLRRQRAVDVSWVSAVLMLATLAAIMMPVSYRAGADIAHPHSVIQGVIDDLRGTPHHHHDEATEVDAARPSSLFAFDVPLSVSSIGLVDAGAPTSLFRLPVEVAPAVDPDLPTIDSLAIGGDAAGAMSFLTAIAALLLLVILDRRLWTMAPRLRGIVPPLRMPPPRSF